MFDSMFDFLIFILNRRVVAVCIAVKRRFFEGLFKV